MSDYRPQIEAALNSYQRHLDRLKACEPSDDPVSERALMGSTREERILRVVCVDGATRARTRRFRRWFLVRLTRRRATALRKYSGGGARYLSSAGPRRAAWDTVAARAVTAHPAL